ncbi:MAG: hypothetical protein KDD55_01260 [Bdellovibrionales bacterium]|nr:hypothetical protein [Bdellovibrionales bacterium]
MAFPASFGLEEFLRAPTLQVSEIAQGIRPDSHLHFQALRDRHIGFGLTNIELCRELCEATRRISVAFIQPPTDLSKEDVIAIAKRAVDNLYDSTDFYQKTPVALVLAFSDQWVVINGTTAPEVTLSTAVTLHSSLPPWKTKVDSPPPKAIKTLDGQEPQVTPISSSLSAPPSRRALTQARVIAPATEKQTDPLGVPLGEPLGAPPRDPSGDPLRVHPSQPKDSRTQKKPSPSQQLRRAPHMQHTQRANSQPGKAPAGEKTLNQRLFEFEFPASKLGGLYFYDFARDTLKHLTTDILREIKEKFDGSTTKIAILRPNLLPHSTPERSKILAQEAANRCNMCVVYLNSTHVELFYPRT